MGRLGNVVMLHCRSVFLSCPRTWMRQSVAVEGPTEFVSSVFTLVIWFDIIGQ
jgi:hypothetical protein